MTKIVAFLLLSMFQSKKKIKPNIRLVFITFPVFAESVVSNFLGLFVNIISAEVFNCTFEVHKEVWFISAVLGIFTIKHYQDIALINEQFI